MRRVQAEDGSWYIPASVRPNGTIRPAQRIRPGYVPPEERSRFKPRVSGGGDKATDRSSDGLSKELIEARQSSGPSNVRKSVDQPRSLDQLLRDKLNLSSENEEKKKDDKGNKEDLKEVSKSIVRMKKRLREAEALKKRQIQDINAKLQPDQVAKVERRAHMQLEISNLQDRLKSLKEKSNVEGSG